MQLSPVQLSQLAANQQWCKAMTHSREVIIDHLITDSKLENDLRPNNLRKSWELDPAMKMTTSLSSCYYYCYYNYCYCCCCCYCNCYYYCHCNYYCCRYRCNYYYYCC